MFDIRVLPFCLLSLYLHANKLVVWIPFDLGMASTGVWAQVDETLSSAASSAASPEKEGGGEQDKSWPERLAESLVRPNACSCSCMWVRGRSLLSFSTDYIIRAPLPKRPHHRLRSTA